MEQSAFFCRLKILATIFACAGLLFSTLAHAQVTGFDTGGYLRIEPTYPEPNSDVTVHLELYSVSLNGASIRWYENGTEIAGTENARSATVTTGPFGTSVTVRAVVTPTNSPRVTIERTLTPSQLDVIVEADTSVPSFYKGRALPASREAVGVSVVPHIPGYANPGTLMYKWTLGNTVLFGGPVQGKTRADFTMPTRRTNLFVEVTDSGGSVLGGEAILLEPTNPELYFYEDNPLRGTSERSIVGTLTLVENETTVRAEPYFVAPNIFEIDPVGQWSIDGARANHGENMRTLTLRAEGGSGEARIGFKLTNRHVVTQNVDEAFTIYFE